MADNPRLQKRQNNSYKRKTGTREPKRDSYCSLKINISYEYYIENAYDREPQSFKSWEEENRLSSLNETLKSLCQLTMAEAIQRSFIKIYGQFPQKSKFDCPTHLLGITSWATLNRISGQKARVCGYVQENTFYIVFLDKNHDFWPTEKKHT